MSNVINFREGPITREQIAHLRGIRSRLRRIPVPENTEQALVDAVAGICDAMLSGVADDEQDEVRSG